MYLALTDRIGEGTFGDVFAPPPGDRAWKIFRRIEDPSLAHVAPYVFEAETKACEIAHRHPSLQPHVPKYFGSKRIAGVRDEQERDVSSRYWLDLCYVMQRVPPDPCERKFGSFYETRFWPRMELLEQAFEGAGICHLGDASVLHWRQGTPVLIDFAVWDAAANHVRLDV